MPYSRRSILSALGVSLPFGLGAYVGAAGPTAATPPSLRFRPFEQAVRQAFADRDGTPDASTRRIEVGHSDLVRAGVQGCHNDRPFAGFPAGHLRIVQAESGPGPARQGVRLFVSTVEVALTGGPSIDPTSRPLDFASLPPAPSLA